VLTHKATDHIASRDSAEPVMCYAAVSPNINPPLSLSHDTTSPWITDSYT